MAVNPPINEHGTPFRLQDEYILMERKGTEIEVKIPGRSSLSAKGKIFLTTARMVFVNKSFQSDKFKSFDMPIITLSHFEFKQPVFGSNYLQFDCKPINQTLPQVASVKIWFTEGGCDKFLRSFEHVSKQVNEQRRNRVMNQNLYNNWREGFFNTNKSFYDPSDPTVVLTEQPPIFTPDQKYYGENIYINPVNNYPTLAPMPPGQSNPQPTPPPVPNSNNYPILESGQHNGIQIGSTKNDYNPNFNNNQQNPMYSPQNNFPTPLPPLPEHTHLNQPHYGLPTPPPPVPGQNTLNYPQYNQPIPPPPVPGQNTLNYPQYSQPTPPPPVPGQNVPHYPQYSQPTPPPPVPGQMTPHYPQYNQPIPPPPVPGQTAPNQPYPPQPGQPNVNYPQYNQNVPQMYNPYPAMNNQQNAGYYFGFWGPQLTPGNQ